MFSRPAVEQVARTVEGSKDKGSDARAGGQEERGRVAIPRSCRRRETDGNRSELGLLRNFAGG